jgi:hypothetical protein
VTAPGWTRRPRSGQTGGVPLFDLLARDELDVCHSQLNDTKEGVCVSLDADVQAPVSGSGLVASVLMGLDTRLRANRQCVVPLEESRATN